MSLSESAMPAPVAWRPAPCSLRRWPRFFRRARDLGCGSSAIAGSALPRRLRRPLGRGGRDCAHALLEIVEARRELAPGGLDRGIGDGGGIGAHGLQVDRRCRRGGRALAAPQRADLLRARTAARSARRPAPGRRRSAPVTKAPTTPRPRRPVTARWRRAAATGGVDRLGRRRGCVAHGLRSLYAGFGQPVDLIQHRLAGGTRCRDGRLEGQRRQGVEGGGADGNGGDVPQRVGEARVADQLGKGRRRARRKERRGIERAGFQRGPRRLRQRAFLAGVVEREAMDLETVGRQGFGEIERDIDAGDVDQRSLLGIEAAPDQRRPAPRRRPPPRRRRRSPGPRPSRPSCRRPRGSACRAARSLRRAPARRWRWSAARSGRPQGRRRSRRGGRRISQPEQRRDDRRVAAFDQRRRQRRRLAFGPGDQDAHALSVAGAPCWRNGRQAREGRRPRSPGAGAWSAGRARRRSRLPCRRAQHAMAGHDDGNGIASARHADGARPRAQRHRHAAIGRGLAERDLAHHRPDPLLDSRCRGRRAAGRSGVSLRLK